MSTASISTEPHDLPAAAPIARSSASSCVRWATMIENVLKIMNTPTNSAIAANTEQEVVEVLQTFLIVALVSFGSSLPVCTTVYAGRAGLDVVAQLVAGDTAVGLDVDDGELAGLAEHHLLRGRRVNSTSSRRPSSRAAGVLHDPDDLVVCAARAGAMHVDRVADVEPGVLASAAVDDDLVVGGGARALRSARRARPRRCPVAAELRRPG